eukprot:10784338-Ditylum_brightwellii.AAC.1
MEIQKIKVKKVSQGSSNPYSKWARVIFKFAKQVGVCSGTINPYHHHDSPIPPPSNDTKQSLINDYDADWKLNEFHLKMLMISIEASCHPRQHG